MMASVWRRRGAIALVAALCATGSAHAQRVGQRIVIEPPIDPIGDVQVVDRHKPILTQVARSDRHVKLQAPVRESYKHLLVNNVVDLPVGAILHSASYEGDVFCAPFETVFSACLEDTDQDGRFDVIYEAALSATAWTYLAFHTDRRISTAYYSSVRRLPPVAYVEAAPNEALTSFVDVVLYDNYSAKAPQRRVKVTLNAFIGGVKYTSMRADSGPIRMDADGGGYGGVLGSAFQILGFEPDGGVRYRVLRPIDSAPAQFNITPF